MMKKNHKNAILSSVKQLFKKNLSRSNNSRSNKVTNLGKHSKSLLSELEFSAQV